MPDFRRRCHRRQYPQSLRFQPFLDCRFRELRNHDGFSRTSWTVNEPDPVMQFSTENGKALSLCLVHI